MWYAWLCVRMEWFWRWSRSTFWLVNPLFLLETFLLHTFPSILSSQGILVNFSLCSIKPLLFTRFCLGLVIFKFLHPPLLCTMLVLNLIFAFNVLKNSFYPVHLEQWQQICDWHPPLLCTLCWCSIFFFCVQCLEEQLLSCASWAMEADLWLTFDGKEKRSYLKRTGIESDMEIENSNHSVPCYLWIHALDVQCNLPPISIPFVYACIIFGDNQTTIRWWWAVYMRKGWCLDMAGKMTSGMT